MFRKNPRKVKKKSRQSGITLFAFFTKSPQSVLNIQEVDNLENAITKKTLEPSDAIINVTEDQWKEKIRQTLNSPEADVFIVKHPDWNAPTLKSLNDSEIQLNLKTIATNMQNSLRDFPIHDSEIAGMFNNIATMKIPDTLQTVFILTCPKKLSCQLNSKYVNIQAGTEVEETGFYRCGLCSAGVAWDLLSKETGSEHLAGLSNLGPNIKKFWKGDVFDQCQRCGPATGWSSIDWVL